MSNALLEYLTKRMGVEHPFPDKKKHHGPLITISRQVGCNAENLANKIADRLNQRFLGPNWRVLSKEIFYKSAQDLDLHPEHVIRVFRHQESYTLNDILNAFGTRKFKSERKVIKTVNEVIRSFAEEGFCIIVGRASNIIASDIEHALHLRLIAPNEYRIKTIMENDQLNREDAILYIEKLEKERRTFRKALRKDAPDKDTFDVCINRASFEDEETIDLIEFAAEKKGIFRDLGKQIDFY